MARLPTTLLTGFLGSGKTTLLTGWLRAPEFADTAVIINEAGAVQIDGTLVGRASENVQVLEGGCVCCKVLDDLSLTILRLLDARAEGTIPAFARLVIETSGLADPGPIAAALLRDPRLHGRIGLLPTVAVLDAVNGMDHLNRYAEARSQILHAGTVIVTKAEALEAEARAWIEAAVRSVNPHVPVTSSTRAQPAAPPAGPEATAALPPAAAAGSVHGSGTGHHNHHVHSQLQAHAFRFGAPIHGASLVEAVDLMEQLFEGRIVRTKSLFHDRETDCGYVMHSVGGTLETPEEIAGLDVAETGIVVFATSLPRNRIRAVISPFVALQSQERPGLEDDASTAPSRTDFLIPAEN